MEAIKNNFFFIVVSALLMVIILLQTCRKDGTIVTTNNVIKRDTTWMHKDSTIIVRPQIVKVIPVDVVHDSIIREYIPDTSYAKLIKQYQSLVAELLNKNVYKDSLKIDSIGWVHVADTVQKNLLSGRSYNYNLKYPIIKETIIKTNPPVNQWFIGGQIFGSNVEPVESINVSLLIQNKKDNIIGGSIGINREGRLQYGVETYWKIKL